jgi:hypothetical protein
MIEPTMRLAHSDLTRRDLLRAASASLVCPLVLASPPAAAQDFPDVKAIKLLSGSAPAAHLTSCGEIDRKR